MRATHVLIPWTAILLVACLLVACGTTHMPNGELQSISISPSTARSQAQFTAKGSFSDGTRVSPLPALWSPGNPWVQPMSEIVTITVDANGKAACASIAGTFTIEATAPVDPHFALSQMGPMTPQISGMAQLTCP